MQRHYTGDAEALLKWSLETYIAASSEMNEIDPKRYVQAMAANHEAQNRRANSNNRPTKQGQATTSSGTDNRRKKQKKKEQNDEKTKG